MANWGNAFAQALAGGAAGGLGGAASGSVVPGIGTAIGGTVGGLAGGLAGFMRGFNEGGNDKKDHPQEGEAGWFDWLFGTPEGQKFFSQFSPEDQKSLTSLRDQAMEQLKNPYEGFEPIRQNALRSFFEDIVPGLQQQFSSSGQNAISSPVLQTNLSSAGSGLAQRLAGQQAQFGQQNRQNALQQLNMGIRPRENIKSTGTQGLAGSILPSLAKGGVAGLANYYGTPEADRNFQTFSSGAFKALAPSS